MTATLPHIRTAIPGPRSIELAARLRKVECAEITALSDDFPVFWKSASGCLVTDVDGNVFLDAAASFGVLGVGHSHPRVDAAIERQASALIHGMGDVHPSEIKVRLLERIAQFAPIPDCRTILGTNGSDAVEAALKTARLATGKPGLLAFDGGYHGLTYGALEVTARGFFRDPFADQRGGFARHIPFGGDPAQADAALAAHSEIGAVIAEPIQGRGGIRIPPDGWLASLREICDRRGVLLILDEIFTGWGRTGYWFACNREKVVPDLLCVGKTMAGGMPISACIGSRDVMERAWGAGSTGEARHTLTFLGHPLACAAGVAAIEALHHDKLIARSRTLGDTLLASLRDIGQRHPSIVCDVRGRGLMIGIELRDPSLTRGIVVDALRRGLIILPAGDCGEVIELTPPFVMTETQADWMLATVEACLSAAGT